jgi:hypothetical protein
MNPPDQPCQATPAGDLRQQILDSRVPKNEREWWASREIEKLERELAETERLRFGADADRRRLRCELATASQAYECAMAIHGTVMEERDRLAAELTAARSERDLAITRVACILWSGAIDKHTCGDVQKWADYYTAELTRLRAENERLTGWLADPHALHAHCLRTLTEGQIAHLFGERMTEIVNRAEKAEAELADWSVLKAWGGTPEIIHQFVKGQQNRIHHCQDIEAELATERARLDYLGLHMGTRMVAEALNCDYSKCFPIRDAIDAAMKNETTTP